MKSVTSSCTLRTQSSASLATINFDTHEAPGLTAQLREFETAPPVPDPRESHPVPVVGDMPLDEQYPSLLDWIHPVVDTEDLLPPQATGRFGAGRNGIDREECGRGHCGVDLGGPIGRPIVSVGDGVVVRIDGLVVDAAGAKVVTDAS